MEVLLDSNIVVVIKRHLENSTDLESFLRHCAMVRLFCCHPKLYSLLPARLRRFHQEQNRSPDAIVSYGPRDIVEAPAMCAAAASGDLQDVRQLLAAGLSVNAVDTGGRRSPLDWACVKGHADVAALLVMFHADVNHTSGDCGTQGPELTRYNTWTPLHLAAEARSKELVAMLLKAKAGVNGPSRQTPTPLCILSRHRIPHLVAMLTQHGGRLV